MFSISDPAASPSGIEEIPAPSTPPSRQSSAGSNSTKGQDGADSSEEKQPRPLVRRTSTTGSAGSRRRSSNNLQEHLEEMEDFLKHVQSKSKKDRHSMLRSSLLGTSKSAHTPSASGNSSKGGKRSIARVDSFA